MRLISPRILVSLSPLSTPSRPPASHSEWYGISFVGWYECWGIDRVSFRRREDFNYRLFSSLRNLDLAKRFLSQSKQCLVARWNGCVHPPIALKVTLLPKDPLAHGTDSPPPRPVLRGPSPPIPQRRSPLHRHVRLGRSRLLRLHHRRRRWNGVRYGRRGDRW